MICLKSEKDSIEKCIKCLKNGDVVLIPTDTVYGFSGIVDETNSTDKKIRIIKGREETKPFIQLIGKPEDIKKYTDDEIPSEILNLWPGPLTVIVNNKITHTTTAFRCPDEKWLLEILRGVDNPVYSTSANRSGTPILEKIEEIKNEFSDEVALIVDDGDRVGGVASTIISVIDGTVKVLREGALKINL